MNMFIYRILKIIVIFLSIFVSMAIYAQQVVYLFDENRALILVGSQCQGKLYYVDKNRGIQTKVTNVFKAVFFNYIHPSEKYIAVPYNDLSAIRVSKDYGRTFETAHFSPGGGPEGTRDAIPKVPDVVSFTVIDDQGFFLTKQNHIYVSSKPLGQRWGLDYVALNAIPRLIYRNRENFQNLPTSVPEVKDYKGWTHMQCDPTK